MNIFRTIQLSWKELFRNKMRTLLTTLGIIIGIATVIVVLSAGEGFRSYIDVQIEAFGTNLISIETRVPSTTKARESGQQSPLDASGANQAVAITSLKNRDAESIRRLPNVAAAYGAVVGQQVVAYKQVSKNAFIFGADPVRFRIDQGKLAAGRPYTEQENRATDQVAILGYDISRDLFGDADPLGQMIRVGAYNFLVIGVYERRGSFGFSNDDQQIFIPMLTAQKKLLGIDHLFYILAQLKDNRFASVTAEDIRRVLRRNHNILDADKDDFTVHTMEEGLKTFNTILAGVTFLLIAIAAISLLVGGVGIMNIMYVAVTERVSEIGLKKALGATNGDILRSFLIESVLLTIGGGMIGILIGAGLSAIVAQIAQSFGYAWKLVVPPMSVVLGLGVAGFIGIVFGVFPARRASRLDPIEALRSEQ